LRRDSIKSAIALISYCCAIIILLMQFGSLVQEPP